MNLNIKKEPLVSICCVAYNHEKFIRQCLNGFIMQKTNFSFEILIHDDASTDKTADIVREYETKYPDIIKPIYQKENQYSKGVKISAKYQYPRAKGKYVALCEGDDYWTDPYKLQKQVDFLESHPEYSLCFHNAIEHWETGKKEDSLFVKNVSNDRDYTGEEILRTWTITTASVVFRKEILYSDLYKKACNERRFIYGDVVLFLTNAELGKLHYLNDTMSVYRKHEGGVVYSFNYESQIKLPEHYKAILAVFGKKYRKVLTRDMISYRYFRLILEAKKRKDYKLSLKSAIKSFLYTPYGFLLALKEYLVMKYSFKE